MDAVRLQNEIAQTIYTGVTGTIDFDANGDTKRPIAITQVQGRKFEKLETYIFEDGRLLRIWD